MGQEGFSPCSPRGEAGAGKPPYPLLLAPSGYGLRAAMGERPDSLPLQLSETLGRTCTTLIREMMDVLLALKRRSHGRGGPGRGQRQGPLLGKESGAPAACLIEGRGRQDGAGAGWEGRAGAPSPSKVQRVTILPLDGSQSYGEENGKLQERLHAIFNCWK